MDSDEIMNLYSRMPTPPHLSTKKIRLNTRTLKFFILKFTSSFHLVVASKFEGLNFKQPCSKTESEEIVRFQQKWELISITHHFDHLQFSKIKQVWAQVIKTTSRFPPKIIRTSDSKRLFELKLMTPAWKLVLDFRGYLLYNSSYNWGEFIPPDNLGYRALNVHYQN